MASGKRSHHRENLAYLAARIMAEDGSHDFSSAKRKAARMAGVPSTHQLPDNREIEAALRSWQALYQRDSRGPLLRHLREVAVKAMQILQPFDPWLVGSVLTGTAGPHSDVNLQLFADSGKELEMFLLNRQIAYQTADHRVKLGDRWFDAATYTLPIDETTVTATLLTRDALRIAQKTADGRALERARLPQVQALLDTDTTKATAF